MHKLKIGCAKSYCADGFGIEKGAVAFWFWFLSFAIEFKNVRSFSMKKSGLLVFIGILAGTIPANAADLQIVPPSIPNLGSLFISHEEEGRSGHGGQAITEAGNGDVIAFYSNVSGEVSGGHGVAGWSEYKISGDGGETWSEPYILDYSVDVWNGDEYGAALVDEVMTAPNGTIVAVVRRYTDLEGASWANTTPVFLRSYDHGLTWSEPVEIDTAAEGFPGVRDEGSVVHNGSLFVLFNDHSGGRRHSLWSSADNGETFQMRSVLPFDTRQWYGTIGVLANGDLIVYSYNSNDDGRVLQYVTSDDDGYTWSQVGEAEFKKRIRNPQISRKIGGKYFMHGRSGHGGPDPRHLVLYSSKDGIEWDDGIYLNRGATRDLDSYSTNAVVGRFNPDIDERLLIQSSVAYDEVGRRVNLHHWRIDWMESEDEKRGAHAGSFKESVGGHDALIHHYTFEDNPFMDAVGGAHLEEVSYGDDYGGELGVSVVEGVDSNSSAIFTRHVDDQENRGSGAYYRTIEDISLGERVTLEVVFRPMSVVRTGYIANVWGDSRGYFLIQRHWELAHRIGSQEATSYEKDGSAYKIEVGAWYYFAVTFEMDGGGDVTIRPYIANLTRGERSPIALDVVLLEDEAANWVGSSPFGIGGFQSRSWPSQDVGAASVFSGEIEQVALYGKTLAPEEIEEHVSAIWSQEIAGVGFEEWIEDFELEEGSDGFGDNPSGDGISNVLKYALGLDPRKSSVGKLPATGMKQINGLQYLFIEAAKNPEATDVAYRVEVSGNLESWKSGEGSVAIVEDSENWIRVRDMTPVTDMESRFIRLKVSFAK